MRGVRGGGAWLRTAAIAAVAFAVVACATTVGVGRPEAEGGDRTDAAAAMRPPPVARDGAPPRPHPAPRHPPAPREVTIAAAGDVLIHVPVARAAAAFGAAAGLAYDFRPMLEPIRPVVEAADLALCHLEVPLSRTTLSGYPLFSAPVEVADAVAWAGFDGCSTASNHAVDQGVEGLTTTLAELERVGLRHAGTARDPEEALTPTLYDVAGVTVAHLSYTESLNGLPQPPDRPWSVAVLDSADVREDARAARGAGADLVVASLHWGVEYQREPTDAQRAIAADLLGDGAVDLLVGHHAHVVQPIGWVGDRVVVYGAGNLLSAQSGACCGAGTEDGVVVTVTLREADDGGFRAAHVTYTPTWVDRADGYRVVDVGAALRADPADPRRADLEASWGRTVEAVELDGPHPAVQPGPR